MYMALFATTALALNSASGSVLSSEALSMYVKPRRIVPKQLWGQAILSRIETEAADSKGAKVDF